MKYPIMASKVDGFRTKSYCVQEACRALLQLLINILPSCITLVLYIYYRFLFVAEVYEEQGQ